VIAYTTIKGTGENLKGTLREPGSQGVSPKARSECPKLLGIQAVRPNMGARIRVTNIVTLPGDNVYALDTDLNLSCAVTKQQVASGVTGHLLTQGQLTGIFSRNQAWAVGKHAVFQPE
jgi:hypothetical protein